MLVGRTSASLKEKKCTHTKKKEKKKFRDPVAVRPSRLSFGPSSLRLMALSVGRSFMLRLIGLFVFNAVLVDFMLYSKWWSVRVGSLEKNKNNLPLEFVFETEKRMESQGRDFGA